MGCADDEERPERRGLRAKEVAERIGVSVRTLADWRRCKRGPPFHRFGPRLVVYMENELEKWIRQHRVG